MHEMGLCEAVLGVVRDVSGDEPVSRVRLRVGQQQGVVPDVFEMNVSLATHAVQSAHLVPEFFGTTTNHSWISSQSPPAGATVDPGSTVKMHLSNITPP